MMSAWARRSPTGSSTCPSAGGPGEERRLHRLHLLPLQPEHTELAHFEKTDAVTYLRTQAIARIVLDNVPNIQASWVTMGTEDRGSGAHVRRQ